jgi:hypothetical protein
MLSISHHARTLFDLTMKDVRFIWGLPQEDSFMKLKELVTSAPVLVLPNDDLLFRLEAAAPASLPVRSSPNSRTTTMCGTPSHSCPRR